MNQILARFQLVLLLIAGFAPAAAPAWAESLPEIIAHSQTQFSVYKGDKLTLEVQAKGSNLESKWLRSHDVFCRTLRCEVDTGDWSLGNHNVVFVVFNKSGSLFVKFQVRVLTAPAGYKPGKVVPPLLQDDKAIEAVATDDLTVKSLSGRGYSYHKKKVQIVGPMARSIEWSEKLRTRSASALRVGREGSEAHILAGSTAVYLSKSSSGRRVLALRRGALRDRVLDHKDPRWSVSVDDWLQVDTDSQGDVLVERLGGKEDEGGEDADVEKAAVEPAAEGESGEAKADGAASGKVRVTVLRGNARVYVSKGPEKADSGRAFVLPQGLSATFSAGDVRPVQMIQPRPKDVSALVALTTPQYLPGEKPAAEGKGQSLLGDQKIKTLDNAIAVARTANGQRDFFVAIEALAPFADELKGHYDASLLLAEAYRGIYLYDGALQFLQLAIEAKPDAPEPYFARGLIELHGHGWKRAVEAFEAAEDRDYPDEQLLDYYLGIAHYNAGNSIAAKSAFTYSLWQPDNDDVTGSARRFYDRLGEEGWLDLRFDAGVLYDSNVLRASSKLDLSTIGDGKIKKNKSAGYLAGAGFSLWAARSDAVKVSLNFDIEKRAYLDSGLAALGVLDEKLGLATVLGFGGEAGEKKLVAVDVEGYARSIYIGEERSMDILGSDLGLGSPRLLGLRLHVESALALDPLPARNDILDPILWEVVPAGERSCRLIYYGLGLVPVDGQVFHVAFDAKSGGGVYRSYLHTAENFKDLVIKLHLTAATSMRNEIGLGLAQTKRGFAASEDKRKDSNTALDLGWKWAYTTSLYHRVAIEQESQTSNNELAAYKRQTMTFKLNLDF